MNRNFFVFVFVNAITFSCNSRLSVDSIRGIGAGLEMDSSHALQADVRYMNDSQDSVDILQNRWLNNQDSSSINKLEEMLSTSDGEVSEYIDITIVNMFKQRPVWLIDYLYYNRTSRVYGALTRGLSMELYVYDRDVRILKKRQMKEQVVNAYAGRLDVKKTEFIQQIFIDVEPEKYD